MNRVAAAALLVVLAGWPAAAQTVAPQTPSFKAGVELVRLDVEVTDADGRPIRDLKQNEVEVTEAGRARPIVLFQHIEQPAETYQEIASRTIASEVSTNQGSARGRLYVLVFDQLHILPGHEQRARQAAQRFLQTHLRRGDRAAVYAFPGPGLQTGFTADGRHLATMLSAVRGGAEAQQDGVLGAMSLQEAFQIVRGDDQTLRGVTDRIRKTSSEVDTTGLLRGENSEEQFKNAVKESAHAIATRADGESRRMLSMLVDVLRPMRTIEGRKTILFFSEGFNGDNLRREIDEVAAAAAQSYSSIDAIDLSRRTADMTLDEPSVTDAAIGIHDAMTPLGSLAAETNGRLILDAAGRLDEVFAAIADRSQDYYLVGFTPLETAGNGADNYHPVSVRVHRSGARVNTRTGFALDNGASRLTRRDAIDRALSAPFPQQGLPVRYTTYVLRGTTSGMQRVVMSLETDLPVTSAQQSHPADVVFVVKAVADGHIVASGTDSIRLPEAPDRGTTTGIGAYHVQFDAPPGDYIMRAVVREPGGLLGSADRRLTVRPLDGPSVSSGDLVLASGRGELPVRPSAYVGDGLSGVLELYGRTTDQVERARVTFDLIAAGDQDPLLSSSGELDGPRPLTNGVARTARLALPLQGIAPGAYVARATVRVGPDTVAEVVRELEIRSGRRPSDESDPAADVFDPREIVNGALAREYLQALTRAASPATAAARRGLERLGAGDFPGAIAALQAVIDADPKIGATAFFLGWAFHGAGDDRQAISAWRRAAFVDPTLVPAHLALADMYVRLSQPALAVQALRAGLTALPNSPELRDRLSKLEQSR
ncbi:MAG TPA: VWA domain-containing protein [Vicinamibacterales bacterium]|jgi:VWFA-related protein